MKLTMWKQWKTSRWVNALICLTQPPNKKTMTQHFAPITTAILGMHLGKSSIHKLRVLFDSGSTGSIIVAKFIKIYK
jgi:hypothetical protein